MVIWMVWPLVEAFGVVDVSAGTLPMITNTSTGVNNNVYNICASDNFSSNIIVYFKSMLLCLLPRQIFLKTWPRYPTSLQRCIPCRQSLPHFLQSHET